ncbi:hypothetical protein SDC9_116036 [bioreactor metagenome]|uniref:Uncharacterized protein n=1 Tax=bioreactor metagenome TaxID=1076179 RepID=A0A645BV09_9ZZZZ
MSFSYHKQSKTPDDDRTVNEHFYDYLGRCADM